MRGLLGKLKALAKANPDVATSVGTGSVLTAGMGTLFGGPTAGVAYGAADFLASYPATLAARKLSQGITKPVNILGKQVKPETVRGSIEGAANLGASLASPMLVEPILSRPQMVEPTVISQEQQIMEQMAQRAGINQMQVPQAVAPGTQFQMQGLESTFLRNYTKPQSYMSSLMPGYDDALSQLRNPLG